MATKLKVTVLVERDGQVVDGFPLVKALTCDMVQEFEYVQGAGVNAAAVPDDKIGHVQALILRGDQAMVLHLNQNLGLALNANSLVVLVDCNIFAGAGALNNSIDTTAVTTIRGLGAGAA